MNGLERVGCAIERRGPDRVPLMHVSLPGAFARHGDRLRRLYERYPSDVLLLGETGGGEFSGRAGVPSVDAWGSTWVSATDDYKGLVERPLLETWDDLAGLRAPSPAVSPEELKRAESAIAADGGRRYVLVDGDTLWQRMFYLRGFEQTLVDLALHAQQTVALRDLILEFLLERIRLWLPLPVHGFMLRDDWGTQASLMVAPDLWRRFFRPAYARIADLVHSGGRHLWFHSDGCIVAIIPDLIEIGVDVLNPQEDVVGVERLGREFGGRVCFLGDIDRQRILPFGTPAEVRQRVRRSIEALGRFDGGYIARGEAAADVPFANIEAMLVAFAEFGAY